MRFNLSGTATAAAARVFNNNHNPAAVRLPEHGGLLQRPVVNALRSVFKHFDVAPVRQEINEAFMQRMIASKQLEESFYVCDLGKVTHQFRQWRAELPRVETFMAVKCAPDPAILATLAGLGSSFDCASAEEMNMVLNMGLPAERILYAHPCKLRSHIRHARANGIKKMTFDNEEELRKIAAEYPEAQVILRIATDDSKSMCAFSSKFGAVMSNAPRLINVARELQLDFTGVSFHVGSGCGDPQAFTKALRDCRTLFDHAESLGYAPHIVDIGGGFPGYDPSDAEGLRFADIAAVVRAALERYFPARPGLRVIAEPGRYFSAASHTLAVSIHSKRAHTEQTGANPKTLYYIDDGVYHSFNCILFDHQQPEPIPLLAPPAELAGSMFATDNDKAAAAEYFVDETRDMKTLHASKVYGWTCDSMDCIAENAMLPDMKTGDWLMFRNMGSYTRASATQFNGFSLPTPHYVCTDANVLNALVM